MFNTSLFAMTMTMNIGNCLSAFMTYIIGGILICGGTGCNATERTVVKNTIVAEVNKRGLSDKVKIVETGCNGFCDIGPTLIVQPTGIFYVKVKSKDIPELVEEQIIIGQSHEILLNSQYLQEISVIPCRI